MWMYAQSSAESIIESVHMFLFYERIYRIQIDVYIILKISLFENININIKVYKLNDVFCSGVHAYY